MKKAKSLLCIVLAFMLVCVMAIPAFAADDGSIVISGTTNVSVAGKTFNAYKVLDAAFVDETDTSKGVAYTVPEGLEDFYAEYFSLNAESTGFDSAVVKAIANLSDDELNAFADAVLAAAKESGITAATETAGASDTSVTIDGLALGYYVIEDATVGASGANTAISSVMLDTTDKKAEVTIKADLPTLDKSIVEGDETTDVNNAAIGDTVDFLLTATVPNDTEYYDAYTYTITDTLSAGLAFVTDEDGKLVLEVTDGVEYTATISGQTVTIDITNIKALTIDTIEIEYSAIVDTDAVIGTTGNINTAYLEYSNNPQDSTSKGKTPDAITTTFVTGISITKVDSITKDTLAGAKFEIAGTALNTVIVKDGDGNVVDTIEKATDVKYTGTSNDDGIITFEGLAAGTYTITEIIAPEGYNLLDAPITVTISWTAPADGETECTWTVTTEDEIAEVDENGVIVVTIANSTGTLLPSTGGIGTVIFYVIGGLLVVGAVVLLITRKKASSEA